jgi:DNA-binding transcriptional regulator YdaS (Cro superfamily)
MTKRDTALAHAIEVAGGPTALAKKLGVTPQAICDWKRCPPRRVIAVEAATGGVVTRHRLRPDLYPQEKRAA